MSKKDIIAERIEQRARDRGLLNPEVRCTEQESEWCYAVFVRTGYTVYMCRFSYPPDDEESAEEFDSTVEKHLDRMEDMMP